MICKYTLTLTPNVRHDADVPSGDGHYIRTALTDGAGTSLPTLTTSQLCDGPFRAGDDPHTKKLLSDESYKLYCAVQTPSEIEALDRLFETYQNGSQSFTLEGVTLDITDVDRHETTLGELLTRAESLTDETTRVRLWFKTPTCVLYPNSSITEMFPHRTSVFTDLLTKWNTAQATDTDATPFDITQDELGEYVYEKPWADTYRTFSVLTRVKPLADQPDKKFFRQGYSTTCQYEFRNAPEHLMTAVITLALYAEYAGVGTDTGYGCGTINTEIITHD
jgi:hypothetical protein